MVLIGSCSGKFYALDRRSGLIHWSYNVNAGGEQFQFHGDPLVRDGAAFVGTDGTGVASVWSFDVRDGTRRWRYELLDESAQEQGVPTTIIGPPAAVCGATFSDEVFCVDAKRGALLWKYQSSQRRNAGTLRPSPALVKGVLLFPALDANVYALDAANGALKWKRKLAAPIRTSIVTDDRSAYVGCENGHLYRLRATDGAVEGDINLGSTPYFTPLLHAGNVYVFTGSDENNRLVAVDRALKNVLWRQTTPGGWSSPRPYAHRATVIAGTEKGDVVALDVATGKLRWSEHFGGVIRAIGVDGDVLYAGALTGGVTAFRAPSNSR